MDISEKIIAKTLKIAFLAGKAIMDIYNQPFTFELKPDNSPLTIADQKANIIILEGLKDSGIPILSEEGTQIDFDVRKHWKQYWLIDPLDGTKEFIKKNGDFTVNIALISDSQPIIGVVYAPVPGIIYWGSESGSFRLTVNKLNKIDFDNFQSIQILAECLPCISKPESYTVLGSKSHMNTETESFISNLQKLHPHLSFVSRGSSLKFCTLAEGGADVYPRFGPTMEWDTAAGHAVAVFAGCSVYQVENGLPVTYNKPYLLNPFFIAEQKK
jgi:3'(2'), 5'-bisphosphate nucleotidase